MSFTVEELDLSAADVTVNDVAVAESEYGEILDGAKVNGIAVSNLNNEVEFSADFVNGKAGSTRPPSLPPRTPRTSPAPDRLLQRRRDARRG